MLLKAGAVLDPPNVRVPLPSRFIFFSSIDGVRLTDNAFVQDYPLLTAVKSNREELAIMLLEAGANPNRGCINSDSRPLGEACSRGLVGTVEALVAHGVHATSDAKVEALASRVPSPSSTLQLLMMEC